MITMTWQHCLMGLLLILSTSSELVGGEVTVDEAGWITIKHDGESVILLGLVASSEAAKVKKVAARTSEWWSRADEGHIEFITLWRSSDRTKSYGHVVWRIVSEEGEVRAYLGKHLVQKGVAAYDHSLKKVLPDRHNSFLFTLESRLIGPGSQVQSVDKTQRSERVQFVRNLATQHQKQQDSLIARCRYVSIPLRTEKPFSIEDARVLGKTTSTRVGWLSPKFKRQVQDLGENQTALLLIAALKKKWSRSAATMTYFHSRLSAMSGKGQRVAVLNDLGIVLGIAEYDAASGSVFVHCLVPSQQSVPDEQQAGELRMIDFTCCWYTSAKGGPPYLYSYSRGKSADALVAEPWSGHITAVK